MHVVRIEFLLNPIWHDDPPEIILGLNNDIQYAGKLFSPTTFKIEQLLPTDTHSLWLEFVNKKDSDTQGDLDKAVIVERIIFNDITDPRFVWAGVYRPSYPEPWASEQEYLEPLLKSHTYLGWNGKWTLTFDIPVFTWMHKTLDLGWIYD